MPAHSLKICSGNAKLKNFGNFDIKGYLNKMF